MLVLDEIANLPPRCKQELNMLQSKFLESNLIHDYSIAFCTFKVVGVSPFSCPALAITTAKYGNKVAATIKNQRQGFGVKTAPRKQNVLIIMEMK